MYYKVYAYFKRILYFTRDYIDFNMTDFSISHFA